MFNLRNFIRHGFLDAVGRMADYQIILNAAGWLEKGVLTEADLAEIQEALEAARSGGAEGSGDVPAEDSGAGDTPAEG